MAANSMAAVDAQFYWMSAKLPNDQFLLYAFDDEPSDRERAIEEVCRRARACPDLTMRVQERSSLTYPQWVPAAVGPEQVVRHDLPDDSWGDCLAAVVGLADAQLDVRRMPWRLHVFTPVHGIPGVIRHRRRCGHAGRARGGRRRSRFGDGGLALGPARTAAPGGAAAGGVSALAGRRCRSRPPPAGSRHARRAAGTRQPGTGPCSATNARPDGVRSLRTLVRHRAQLRGPTVTVGVLTAVATALSGLLGDARRFAGRRGADG